MNSLCGKTLQLSPFSSKNILNPPTSFLNNSPCIPFALLKPSNLPTTFSKAAAAVVTIARPRQACAPHP